MKRSPKKRSSKTTKEAAAIKQRELPLEARVPDKAAKRLAIITVIGLVVVLGAAGALLELFVAPLFDSDKNISLEERRHAHPPITSELDFLIQMVPHHQEAIDTALIVSASTTDPKLKALTDAIIYAQRIEIAQMNAWIDAWYPDQRYPHSYVPMMPDLERLQGTTRDEAFLRSMIDHHQAAIIMAQEVQALSPRPEIEALADLIVRAQAMEIMEMQTILGIPMDPTLHAAHHYEQ